MSKDDLPGYMLDEIKSSLNSMGVTTEDELHEYLCDDGGQIFEELGYDFMAQYLRSNNQ